MNAKTQTPATPSIQVMNQRVDKLPYALTLEVTVAAGQTMDSLTTEVKGPDNAVFQRIMGEVIDPVNKTVVAAPPALLQLKFQGDTKAIYDAPVSWSGVVGRSGQIEEMPGTFAMKRNGKISMGITNQGADTRTFRLTLIGYQA